MKTVIIFATILFNGVVENLEYKAKVFSSQEECTKYVSKNQNEISRTLKKHLDNVYPNSEVLIVACSDKVNFVSVDETI
tara:strand:- start:3451 stop:3687 length:237 start_codon:yes stop_codon:yes gene_type:complete